MIRPKEAANQPLINERIRFESVQLITQDGENRGKITRDEAIKLARAADLDLVLIADQGSLGIPGAKIMDYGKVLYAKKKQQAEAKKNQKVIQVKELKFQPKIADHDFQTKMNQGAQFLIDGKRLKITIEFKGREIALREDRGTQLVQKIEKYLEDAGLSKRIVQEKDMKTLKVWSRIYYLK